MAHRAGRKALEALKPRVVYLLASLVDHIDVFDHTVAASHPTRIGTLALLGFGIQILVADKTIGVPRWWAALAWARLSWILSLFL